MLIKYCAFCQKPFRVTPAEATKEIHCSKTCRNDPWWRFLRKVHKQPGCWEWKGAHDKAGYGRFHYEGKWIGAHRAAYMFFVGDIPEGLDVMHLCDNPGCVNPEHLRLGTHLDNMRDMYAKNRRKTHKGEAHHNAKLTWTHVRQIRATYQPGKVTCKMLAQKFGVDTALVHRIIQGKAWKPENDPLATDLAVA